MGNLNQGDSARTVFAPAAKQHATSSQKDHDAFGDTVIRGLRALLTDTMVELQLSRQELGLANEPFIALAPIDLKLNNHTAFMRDELKLSANDIRGALAKPSAGLISKPEPITIRQLSPSNGYPSELQSILSEIQMAYGADPIFAVRHDTSEGYKVELGITLSKQQTTENEQRDKELSASPSMAEGLKGVGAIGLDVFRKAFFLPTARRIEVEKTGREPSGSLAGMNRFAGNITGISTAITLLNGGSLPTGYLSIYLLTVCATNLASSIYEKGRERYIEDQKQKNSAK